MNATIQRPTLSVVRSKPYTMSIVIYLPNHLERYEEVQNRYQAEYLCWVLGGQCWKRL